MNKIEITEITSEHVAEWMQMQLAKAHERNNYADISVGINATKGEHTKPRFNLYINSSLVSNGQLSIEECFESVDQQIAENTPESRANRLEAQAAGLLTQANKIRAEEAAKNQPELI